MATTSGRSLPFDAFLAYNRCVALSTAARHRCTPGRRPVEPQICTTPMTAAGFGFTLEVRTGPLRSPLGKHGNDGPVVEPVLEGP